MSLKITVEGHTRALRIEENLKWILGLMSFDLWVILIKWSAPQPARQADMLTY